MSFSVRRLQLLTTGAEDININVTACKGLTPELFTPSRQFALLTSHTTAGTRMFSHISFRKWSRLESDLNGGGDSSVVRAPDS